MNIFCTLAAITVSPLQASSEDVLRQSTRCHLLLKDYPKACATLEAAQKEHPGGQEFLELAVECYAAAGQTSQALIAFEALQSERKDALLEVIAWNVLEEGIANASPLTRIVALTGVATTGRGRSQALIKRCFSDECSLVRMVACQLAGKLHFHSLIPSLLESLAKDPSWLVRLQCSHALGELKARSAKKALLNALASPHASKEEREAAASSLALIDEREAASWIQCLVQSQEAPLRLLACEIAINNGSDAAILYPLLRDSSSHVQMAALQAIGLLSACCPSDIVADDAICCSQSADACVAASAGWLLTLFGRKEGIETLKRLIAHPRSSTRGYAAAALAATGERSLPLLKSALEKCHADLGAAATLSIGLIGQRILLKEASSCLLRLLGDKTTRWSWHSWGIFRSLSPSSSTEAIITDAIDSATRLELLNILAIVDPAIALPAIRQFLTLRPWGISATAALLLLSEGAEDTLALVKELLNTSLSSQLRLQAALVLALWGRSDAASMPLQAAYKNADRDVKEHILTALGHIPTSSAKSLLIIALRDPSPSLRIHAATALLQALSH